MSTCPTMRRANPRQALVNGTACRAHPAGRQTVDARGNHAHAPLRVTPFARSRTRQWLRWGSRSVPKQLAAPFMDVLLPNGLVVTGPRHEVSASLANQMPPEMLRQEDEHPANDQRLDNRDQEPDGAIPSLHDHSKLSMRKNSFVLRLTCGFSRGGS